MPLSSIAKSEVGDRDLRHATIHESAHAVIAEHLGYGASPEIHRTPDPGPYDKLWIGTTTLYGRIDDAYHARLIGLAGLIAEDIDSDPDYSSVELFLDCLEGGAIELSGTDAAMVGAYTHQDVVDAFDLIKSLWTRIDRRADNLARDAT